MDRGVHGIGADGALEQLVDARGRGYGGGPQDVRPRVNICSDRIRGLRGGELRGVVGERVVGVVVAEIAMVEIVDLMILIRPSINGGYTLNAV